MQKKRIFFVTMCSIGNALYEDLTVQQFTDCYFQFVENDKKLIIAAHKNVLAASGSRVFREMLYPKTQENKEKSSILIQDVPFETFKRLVGCIYDQQILIEDCTVEEIRGLYFAGKKYDFPKAVELARTFMVRSLDLDSVNHSYEMAEMFDDLELKAKCYDLINPIIGQDIHSNEFVFPKASESREIAVKAVREGSELSIALNNYKLFMEEDSKLKDRAGKLVGLVEFLSDELKSLLWSGLPLRFDNKKEDDNRVVDMELEPEPLKEPKHPSPVKRKSLDAEEVFRNKVIKSFDDSEMPKMTPFTLLKMKANPDVKSKKFVKTIGMPMMVPLKHPKKIEAPAKLEIIPPKTNFSQKPVTLERNSMLKMGNTLQPETEPQKPAAAEVKKICLQLFFVHRQAFAQGDHSIWCRTGAVMRKYLPAYIGKELQYCPTQDFCAWDDWKSKGEVSGVNVCFKSKDPDSNVTIVKMKNHESNQLKKPDTLS